MKNYECFLLFQGNMKFFKGERNFMYHKCSYERMILLLGKPNTNKECFNHRRGKIRQSNTSYKKGSRMNPVEKDILVRKNEIIMEVRALFKANMKITDWDVPEADDKLAAELILNIMQEALDTLKEEVKEGSYDNY